MTSVLKGLAFVAAVLSFVPNGFAQKSSPGPKLMVENVSKSKDAFRVRIVFTNTTNHDIEVARSGGGMPAVLDDLRVVQLTNGHARRVTPARDSKREGYIVLKPGAKISDEYILVDIEAAHPRERKVVIQGKFRAEINYYVKVSGKRRREQIVSEPFEIQ